MDPTKRRLLEAAGEEFAEKGFEDGRVRAICERAGLRNQAAVNYHFGDKERLYVEAVLEAHRCSMDELLVVPDPATLSSDQLRQYVLRFMRSVRGRQAPHGWHHALIFREMLRPTLALDAFVDEMIRPRFESLKGILGRICPDAEPRKLHALCFSVIGQCLHYKFAQPVSQRLVGPDAWDDLDADFLAEHIANFTLAALGQVPALDLSGQTENLDAKSVSTKT